ncbi:MAG: hypothetical protein DRR19_01155 [Candidatus Parabeggiatoa sp. nov. 1]|nr:MAG: hypothetical protein DRR19_01155 [Gammaproteobacteria bacterium]
MLLSLIINQKLKLGAINVGQILSLDKIAEHFLLINPFEHFFLINHVDFYLIIKFFDPVMSK